MVGSRERAVEAEERQEECSKNVIGDRKRTGCGHKRGIREIGSGRRSQQGIGERQRKPR